MLFGCIVTLSTLGAVLLCLAADAFAGLAFLWLLPAAFVGIFLMLAALAFGVFVLICAFIDPEKPRQEDSRWFRAMVLTYVDAVLKVLPIQIRTEGLEKIPTQGRFLLVCNHLDNIDPAFLLHCFPKSQLAFVAKQETKNMFLVNKALPMLLCQHINRENDREALKTILKCIGLLKEDKVSVAIFPEGRINKYRKLAHFRPGVFKIAQKAQVPIVVCTIRNTHNVIKRLLKLKGSTVDVHLLGVVPAEEIAGKNTVEVAERIYAMMAQDLGPENVLTPEEEESA